MTNVTPTAPTSPPLNDAWLQQAQAATTFHLLRTVPGLFSEALGTWTSVSGRFDQRAPVQHGFAGQDGDSLTGWD